MMQLSGITSNLCRQEAEAQGGVLPGAQLLSVQPLSLCFPSVREGREAGGHCIAKVNSLSLQVSY